MGITRDLQKDNEKLNELLSKYGLEDLELNGKDDKDESKEEEN